MSVMIGIPIKNSESWLPKSIKQLKALTYPHNKIRIVYEYGKSHDNTLQILKDFAKNNDGFKVEVYKEPYAEELIRFGIQMSATLYKDFQTLLTEDYFMLFDSDIVQIPTNLIEKLMEVDADVVAPYPWSEGHRHFYDNFIFRVNNIRFHPQTPPMVGCTYPVEVDSVGTCFLAKSDTFKNTLIDNPYPNFSFCINAKRIGASVVALPYLEIFHLDIEKEGILHNPLPADFGRYPANGWLDSSTQLKEFKILNKRISDASSAISQFSLNGCK
jgi:glycosyltransferase involved in cell wall biosynthesis